MNQTDTTSSPGDAKPRMVAVGIPSFPGLRFRDLSPVERQSCDQVYSATLLAGFTQGLPSEQLLPHLLKRAIENSGLSIDVLSFKVALLSKPVKVVSEDLLGPFDHLTPAERDRLPPADQQERMKATVARGQRIVELLSTAYSTEEREQLLQIANIEALEEHLREQTAEWAARREQTIAELLAGAVNESGAPYFAGPEVLLDVKPENALVDLIAAWHQFKFGLPSHRFITVPADQQNTPPTDGSGLIN